MYVYVYIYIYIYIYVCVCVCMCVFVSARKSVESGNINSIPSATMQSLSVRTADNKQRSSEAV